MYNILYGPEQCLVSRRKMRCHKDIFQAAQLVLFPTEVQFLIFRFLSWTTSYVEQSGRYAQGTLRVFSLGEACVGSRPWGRTVSIQFDPVTGQPTRTPVYEHWDSRSHRTPPQGERQGSFGAAWHWGPFISREGEASWIYSIKYCAWKVARCERVGVHSDREVGALLHYLTRSHTMFLIRA